MRTLLLWGLLVFSYTATAQAQQCGDNCLEEVPSCQALGYSPSALLSCSEGYVTCPYDSDYVWCKTYNCVDGGLFNLEDVKAQQEQGFTCYETPFHEQTCYTCMKDNANPCVWTVANAGTAELQNDCGNGTYETCVSKCEDADIPSGAGVIPVRQLCQACGKSKTVVTGYTCHSDYRDTGAGCEFIECPEGSSTELTDCANQNDVIYPEGWMLTTTGYRSGGKDCKKCVEKACDPDYTTEPACLDNPEYIILDRGYSGNYSCRKCESIGCNAPYSSNYLNVGSCPQLNAPGWNAQFAWSLEPHSTIAGCGRCVALVCPDTYEPMDSINDCAVEHPQGYNFVTANGRFSGTQYCAKCEPKTCEGEMATNLTLADCAARPAYSSTIGLNVSGSGAYAGENECLKCVCDTAHEGCTFTSTPIAGKTLVGTGGEGKNVCCDGSFRTCTNKSCTGQKTTPPNAKTVTTCTACGDTYYTVTSCVEGYTLQGNTCVKDSCSSYGLINPSDCSGAGYICIQDPTHPNCCKSQAQNGCRARTCSDHHSTYLQKTGGSDQCPAGYKKTDHDGLASGTSTINCYDCDECLTYTGWYNSTPYGAATVDEGYSCEQKLYCATSCVQGYDIVGCGCVEKECPGFGTVNNADADVMKYFAYTACHHGLETLYKVTGCADGYTLKSECVAPKTWTEDHASVTNTISGVATTYECGVCED
ncbi:MAG: hypothetical protein J6X42_03340 [Alphaproteobacteria bacterium]|nr:hypothetical protein [Alphaproteobacteria bacterium]